MRSEKASNAPKDQFLGRIRLVDTRFGSWSVQQEELFTINCLEEKYPEIERQ
jgi:hypothetical protein